MAHRSPGQPHGPGAARSLAAPAAFVLLDITHSLLQAGRDEYALAQVAFEKAGTYLDADVCLNYRSDPQTGDLLLVAGFGTPPGLRQALQRLKPGQNYCGKVAATAQRFVADAAHIAAEPQDSLMHALGMRTYASYPLLAIDGQLLGTFSLASTRRSSFTEEELHLLQALAHFISLAWERIRSEREARRRKKQLDAALDAGHLGTWWHDPVTHLFHMDARAQSHFGFDTEAVALETLLARVEREGAAGIEQEVAGTDPLISEQENRVVEYRVCHPDGSMQWLEVQGKVFHEAPDSDRPAGVRIGTSTDITKRKRAELALRESEASLKATFEQVAVGVVHVDQEGRFLRVNQKFCRMLGYSAEELNHMKLLDAAVESDEDKGLKEFERMVTGEVGSFTTETRLQRRDGTLLWARIAASAVPDVLSGAAFKYTVAIIEDITAYREAEQRARDAALHDPLTGLPNRRLTFEYAKRMLADATRQHGRIAFLFIDLDRFKPINDVYGHEVGDRLLEEVARRLLSCVRHEDLAGRLGGDEFVIVLPHLKAPHHAVTVAHHVIDQVSRAVAIGELNVSVSPSIGISLFPQHGQDVDALIHAADLAMYQAKQSGAGSYEIYNPGLSDRAGNMSVLETRLKQALQRGGLVLHYQPVIDMKSGKPIGAEALLRMADGSGPALGPEQFIPVAEAAGLIGQLGEWVVAEACRQHAAWRAEGLPPIPVAVNVSPLEFRQRNFAKRLISIVKDSGIAPACLQIEVTEGTVMDSVSEAVPTLQALRSAGVRVALDDFGTGYSSLSRLSQLPLDQLKLDRSFVGHLEHDSTSRAITDVVIALGRSLNLQVVGEGIESDHALAYLDEHGCDQGQGYLFSRPLPQDEFAAWYRQHAGN